MLLANLLAQVTVSFIHKCSLTEKLEQEIKGTGQPMLNWKIVNIYERQGENKIYSPKELHEIYVYAQNMNYTLAQTNAV